MKKLKIGLTILLFLITLSVALSAISCAVTPGTQTGLTSTPQTISASKSGAGPSDRIPMTSVPESELTHITFSLGWILKNNMFQNDPNTVKITFPASWLNNAPPVPDGDTPVLLRVPLQMLNLHNTSQNPEEITVVFPNTYFQGMPVAQYVPSTPSPQLVREPPEIHFFTPPGVNPPAKELQISAISGPLDWELETDSGWLTLSSVSGSATAQKETVVVSAGAAGLSAGTYNGTVTLRQKGTDWFQEIPVKLFITSVKTGTALDIPVEAADGSAFKEGIQLGQTTVTTGTMAAGASSWGGGYSGTGDLCLLVRGRFLNTTPEKLTLDFLANGLDGDGKQVSWNLTSGPLIGIAQKDLPANSAVDFQLVLTWAENVNLIQIIANIHHW